MSGRDWRFEIVLAGRLRDAAASIGGALPSVTDEAARTDLERVQADLVELAALLGTPRPDS